MNAIRRLQEVYSPGEARAVYRLVMETRFHLSMTDILLGKDKELSPNDLAEWEIILSRLLDGEPVQYVLGEADFCGLKLHVEPGVLIPRPETAQLVDAILRDTDAGCRVLEIGTGSGCIAVALAKAGYRVTATDVSAVALSVARRNAEQQGVEVQLVEDDVLHTRLQPAQWEVVVSNPPYICQNEAAAIEQLVLDHEPHEALFVPDHDPLLFYRAIARYASRALKPGGTLLFETNTAFAHDVALLSEEVGMECVEVRNDRYGKPREVGASRRVDK